MLFQVFFVHRLLKIQLRTLLRITEVGGSLEIQDRTRTRSEERALKGTRQKAYAPIRSAAFDAFLLRHDDEARQVLIL